MRVSIEKIEEYNLNKETKALALALKVKSVYLSSTIFDYSLPKLMALTGASYGSCKKYVNILIKKGDAVLMCGNLTFKTIRDKSNKFNEDVLNDYGRRGVSKMPINEIEKLLQIAILKHKGKQQAFVVEKNNASVDPQTLKEAKRRAKQIKKTGTMPTGKRKLADVSFSFDTMCKILNKSRDYISKLMKFAVSRGLLLLEKRFGLCEDFGNRTDMGRLNENCANGCYIRTKSGFVYLSLSNLFLFPSVSRGSLLALRRV